jgi:group I intron endonuclease
MKVDYSKGKIYKITNDYNNDVYIGSTCDTLSKRFSNHRRHARSNVNTKIYLLMNEIGFDRFRIELIEDYPCDDNFQLRQKEGFYIRQLSTLNQNIAGRTRKEYKKEEIEKIKKYNEENKERVKNYVKENNEKISQYQKEYRDKRKEENKLYNKEYREKNKVAIYMKNAEKITCECGCLSTVSHLSRHMKTKQHYKLMEEKHTVI